MNIFQIISAPPCEKTVRIRCESGFIKINVEGLPEDITVAYGDQVRIDYEATRLGVSKITIVREEK